MKRILAILALCLPLSAQYVIFMGTNGKATWAKLGSSIVVTNTTPYPTLDAAPPAPTQERAPVTYSFPVVAGQLSYSLPASELSNPRWVLVSYSLVLVEGQDYTLSANKRTVTLIQPAPAPGGILQITAVF